MCIFVINILRLLCIFLCISFKLYLYNFNSRIYIHLVPKVSPYLFLHSSPTFPTFFPNNQLVVVETKNSPQKFFSKSSFLDQVNAIERRRIIFPPLNSTTLRSILDSFDFNSPPMPGWNVIASLSTTSLESNSSRDEAIKSTARLSSPTLPSVLLAFPTRARQLIIAPVRGVSSFWDDRENEISRVQFFFRSQNTPRHDVYKTMCS